MTEPNEDLDELDAQLPQFHLITIRLDEEFEFDSYEPDHSIPNTCIAGALRSVVRLVEAEIDEGWGSPDITFEADGDE